MFKPPELTADPKRDYPHRFNATKIDPSAIILPGVQIFGDVHIGKEANIWFNSVIRGDVNYIRIGDRTNVQDLSMIHVSYHASPTIIGCDVTIGHSVVLHACTIKDFALIGMGTVILDDVEVGEYSIIGAGSLVTKGTKIPPGSLAFGRPAKVVSQVTEEDRERNRFSSRHYVNLAKSYSFLASKPSA